jgi:hypothetical protein
MSPELINTLGTIAGIIVAALGAFLFAFWIAMGIWTFHDIRQRTRDWLVIILAVALVLVFPLIGLILYLMIRPKATLADVYDRALEEEALLRELEQTQACPNCGVPVKDVWVYCPNCHNQLQHSCPNCGNLVRNEWEICVFCGAVQQRSMPQIATVAPAPVAPQAQFTQQAQPQLQTQAGPATTSRTYRSPFRRDSAPPPVAPSTPPPASAVPPPVSTGPDADDSPFRPARMPE